MSQTVLTDTTFSEFDLHPLLRQGLDEAGFSRCTPIQALTLPVALTGRDVAGQAQTGTGKTCAFLVALMNRLLTQPAMATRKDNDPRALIVAPTRELAIQIEKDARAIGGPTGLRIALIYGGVDYDKQRQQLRDGCDIIIATPGRLLDYYKQQVFGFDSVEVMVLDEADRMFDLGFIKDIRFIFRRLPAREHRQVLLFSATLSHRVLELAYEHMHEAEKLVVESDNVTADRVRQLVYFPAKEEKMPLLLNLLKTTGERARCIIFVNTKAAAEKITERVGRYGHRVGALSGDVPQLKRQKLLQRFQDGQLDILVCTDVAARGLHIPAVSHVFNYDLPHDAEDYVHRIGRTARLGAEGDAISFACDLYAMSLPDIETYIGQRIPVGQIQPEWLVMPKAPPVAPAREATETAESAADASARPPRRRRRSGTGRAAGAGEPGRVSQTSVAAAVAVASVSDPAPGHAAGEGGTDPARKRRRRRRGAGRNDQTATASSVASVGQAGGRPTAAEPTAPGVAAAAPAPVVTPAELKPGRPQEITPVAMDPVKPAGLFKRLGRLLFGR
ncbi:DEAD/DEAH box helicase [Frateuria aurantia]|uniref:ATP-dependent RNA helicase RhlB n=1 Tax=Frateuria aurantia (strain ATCC 33424 / DSM 6220 / KCTC 2777 / LMG 1558 / NBRC 3245 / NCIMB 13370) TaxID=767434 RepID=H8KZW2_FRAAD|nr:DEAD/DEAH box helicase [Frateuria aurantia]AFC85243.1 DNA/RNA helicase, superfamily II [Frateuria aurantia DSM 6220]